MDAFDADVLIYASVPGHVLGRRVRALFPQEAVTSAAVLAGVGSLILLPELLTKPTRNGRYGEVRALAALLARLDLRPLDRSTAQLAVTLGAQFRLRAADATHLATAVNAGAQRFITNNRSDFPESIDVIEVTYPDDLPEP